MPALSRTKSPLATPGTYLEKVVVPALEERLDPLPDGSSPIGLAEPEDDGSRSVYANFRNSILLRVTFNRLDEKRAALDFAIVLGSFMDDPRLPLLRIGSFVQNGSFRLNFLPKLFKHGNINLSAPLVIRGNDTGLVTQRIDEMVTLAADLHWFCSLNFANRLDFLECIRLEEAVGDDLFYPDDLADILDRGLRDPLDAEHSEFLPLIARALGRWREFLHLTEDLFDDDGELVFGPVRARALVELGRHEESIEEALAAGIIAGRYEGGPWLSPAYLQALIKTGEDIEALRLLGEPAEGEPGFYDLLRGAARQAVGDPDGADAAFGRYLQRYPGDFLAPPALDHLAGDTD